jgi:hypothetical protein
MNTPLSNDPARRARLNAIKLAALVRDHLTLPEGEAVGEQVEYPGGAALLRAGGEGWVLLDPANGAVPSIGGALAWAHRRNVAHLHLVAETHTGMLARRAAGFSAPVSVWQVQGRELHPAATEALTPSALPPSHHLAFEPDIVAAGAVPVIEHGVLAGEIEGLEMCRVVDDPHTGETRLEVGVGAHDREAFQMLHGNRPSVEPFSTVADAVRRHRRPLDPSHPLGRLALERALRVRLVNEPGLVGATDVTPVPPPVPRRNLKDAVPCAATATIDGDVVAVVCSVGVDLDAVPFAIDTCAALGVQRCLVVMPARDALALQHQLAAAALADIVVVPVEIAP